ncbi:MAG: hypothetical protein AB8E87_14915, partial [Prochlorococcus sp.]
SVGDYEVYHHDHHGTPMERRQAFEEGYLQSFRLPGDRAPETSAPPAASPSASAPSTPASSNQPRFPAPKNQAEPPPASAAPLVGLLLGAGLVIAMVAGVIAMLNRAREEN